MKKLILLTFCISVFSCSNDAATELVTHLDGDLEIRSLADLQDVEIQSYKTISGNLIINYTNGVEDLSELKNLEEVNGVFIRYNDDLKSLKGLENIMTLEFLEIEYNLQLISLSGLDNVSEVAESFILSENDQLENLIGLDNLNKIGTQLFISNNSELTTLSGLDNLSESQQILVLNNNKLAVLDGLDNVLIAPDVRIDSNELLSDFCALTKFAKGSGSSTAFVARFNSFNPTLEDLKNGMCTN